MEQFQVRGTQFERRVFLEHRDQIDSLQRGQHLGAAFGWVDRPPLALEPCGRTIAVQPDHQAIAGGARFRQQLHMTAMQKIEAAIGEAYAQPFRRHSCRRSSGTDQSNTILSSGASEAAGRMR